jgi:hypothetical protein
LRMASGADEDDTFEAATLERTGAEETAMADERAVALMDTVSGRSDARERALLDEDEE